MNSKYVRIYNDIINKIECETYAPEEKLPSEKMMMEYYHVSRDTIRKALTMLEQNGYIKKVNGKGSIVLDIQKFDFPVSNVVSFNELTKQLGEQSLTEVCVLENRMAGPQTRKRLNLEPGEHVWELIRTRSFSGQKVILDKDYIPAKYIEQLTTDICQDSLYKYVENELGYKISYARKEITVQAATEEDKKYLDMKGFDMIAVIKSYTYLDDTSLFQYTESRHRPDKFKFVDFARRH